MIALEGVTKRYGRHGEVLALDDVWLSVAEGEFLVLTGPSGAGKSTMLRLLFAAEQPDSGCVRVLGRDVGRLRRSSIPYLRRNVGVVFQDFKLLPDRSALDNVAIALEIRALPRRVIRDRAADALAAVGLAGKLDVAPRRLSAGEQQRVAIARAVVGDPALLLCDEPTGNLDPWLTQDLLVLFADVHRRGTTVILATHDLQIVAAGERHGWRRAEIDAGRMARDAEQRPPSGGLGPHVAVFDLETAGNVVPFPARPGSVSGPAPVLSDPRDIGPPDTKGLRPPRSAEPSGAPLAVAGDPGGDR